MVHLESLLAQASPPADGNPLSGWVIAIGIFIGLMIIGSIAEAIKKPKSYDVDIRGEVKERR